MPPRDSGGGALRERHAELGGGAGEPFQERVAGEDRGCGDGDVGLGLRELEDLKAGLACLCEQLGLDVVGVGELVDDRIPWFQTAFQEILDRACVAPRQQRVKVLALRLELVVELVVARRVQRRDLEAALADGVPDHRRECINALVGEFL